MGIKKSADLECLSIGFVKNNENLDITQSEISISITLNSNMLMNYDRN
jgi:hypothetical protein